MRIKDNYLVTTTYNEEDVKILLKDLGGKMEPLSTEERERRIQSGTHYSEMLPLEYKPTEEYMEIYERALGCLSDKTAKAVAVLSEILYNRHKGPFVIVSLARAGLPIGILIKRYFKMKYNMELPHYGISIIRGKGIDKNAMNYIYDEHKNIGVEHFQFVDGWIGKGAITRVLESACEELRKDEKWADIKSDLAVLSDPANITDLCGTHEDFLIPSACLNSTVSGLVSRTILNEHIAEDDFHGAVSFDEMLGEDRSYEFIDTVEEYMQKYVSVPDFSVEITEINEGLLDEKGLEAVERIQWEYDVSDINFIKPGVGETTRVLLRRIPWKVLVRPGVNEEEIAHIIRLCKDKGIPMETHDIGGYTTMGIIKDISADV